MQSESNFRVVLLRFLLYRTGEETTNLTYSVDHGRRPQPEEVLSPRDLNALREPPSDDERYGHPGLYRGAHLACRIGPGHSPSPRDIQELVQVWKRMRKWR